MYKQVCVLKQKEKDVLGDIVPNNTNSAGAATAVKPLPVSQTNGFGSTSFGSFEQPAAAASAVPKMTHTFAPSQSASVQPAVAAAPVAQPTQAAQPVAPEASAAVAAPAETKVKTSKIPLVLTLAGVVIFIGGVAGLFIYALGGA